MFLYPLRHAGYQYQTQQPNVYFCRSLLLRKSLVCSSIMITALPPPVKEIFFSPSPACTLYSYFLHRSPLPKTMCGKHILNIRFRCLSGGNREVNFIFLLFSLFIKSAEWHYCCFSKQTVDIKLQQLLRLME